MTDIDSLVNNFSYPQYNDNDIIAMFTDSGFSLESNTKTRLEV
jgi:hypothetical protein